MAPRCPDFLVIGAQKAGTTWLFENLRGHDEIWLPPSKEIHYFDGLWPNSFLLNMMSRVCRENTGNPDADFDELRWFADFTLTHPRTDDWYRALYSPAGDRVAGDITPAYAMIDRQKVAEVHRLMPEVKIIFVMRNPVERIWSHFCFSPFWRHKGIDDADLTTAFMIETMDTEPYDLRTRYLRTISFWEDALDPSQFLYLFHDDIESDMPGFMNRICEFLAIAPLDAQQLRQAEERKNVTQTGLQRQPEVDRYFAGKYLEDVRKLADRFGGAPEKWLRQMERMVG